MGVKALVEGGDVFIQCPGCRTWHSVDLRRWRWNGDVMRPTITPSLHIRFNMPDMVGYNSECKSVVCHSIITDGMISYCGDTTHDLCGRTVELGDIR